MDRNEKVGVSYPTFSIFTHLRAARSLRINSIRSNNSFPDGAECSRESKDCTVDVVLPAPRVNSRPPPLLTHRGVSSTVILACLLEPRAFPPSFPPRDTYGKTWLENEPIPVPLSSRNGTTRTNRITCWTKRPIGLYHRVATARYILRNFRFLCYFSRIWKTGSNDGCCRESFVSNFYNAGGVKGG